MDVLIVTAPKDFNKLPFVVESLVKHIEENLNFFFVSPCAIPDEYMPINGQYLMDHEVVDFDFYSINMKHRRGWYRQQFIKLFQTVTSDKYLVVDSDVWVDTQLNIEKPTFFLGKDQLHKPYFDLMKAVVNLDRVYPHSFISEIMYFERERIHHMLNYIKTDEYGFFTRCVEHINRANDASGFSEYELYGNYVTKNWPKDYQYQDIKVLGQAKKKEWTSSEMANHINANTGKGYDLLTMHSWI